MGKVQLSSNILINKMNKRRYFHLAKEIEADQGRKFITVICRTSENKLMISKEWSKVCLKNAKFKINSFKT